MIWRSTDKIEIEPRRGQVIKPNLIGRLTNEMPGVFEICAYYSLAEVGEGEDAETARVLFLHGDINALVKVRAPMGNSKDPRGVGNVPEYIIEPSMTSLLDELGY